jgi:hypothetical protein
VNTPAQPTERPKPAGGPGRRIAVSVILSLLVFVLVLWVTTFTLVTSLLIGAGFGVTVLAASTISDVVEMLLEAVATVVFGVLAVIAAILGFVFNIFG